MSKLVIVESPAKAKTIQKYLGSDYEVVASMGHVRDLPEKRLSVDVKKNFQPKYDIIKGKEKLVQELKEAALESDMVYLATDPDREGEAISWHLAYILGSGYQRPKQSYLQRDYKDRCANRYGASPCHRLGFGERTAGSPCVGQIGGLQAQSFPVPKDSPWLVCRTGAVRCSAADCRPRG